MAGEGGGVGIKNKDNTVEADPSLAKASVQKFASLKQCVNLT